MTNPKLASIVLALIVSATAVTTGEARTRHTTTEEPAFDRHAVSGGYYYGPVASPRTERVRKKRERTKSTTQYARHEPRGAQREVQLLPHPSGCPSRSFCGCGVALEVFKHHVRELWLAANWYRFPRVAAAPGMVAVRRHHVFVIREVRSSGVVLAYDPNSGGHQTRLHLRSLSGYVVVNPHGSKYAAAG